MTGGTWLLLEVLARGAVALLLALCFARLRFVRAGVRHLVLLAALGWLVVLPFQVAVGPRVSVPVLPGASIEALPRAGVALLEPFRAELAQGGRGSAAEPAAAEPAAAEPATLAREPVPGVAARGAARSDAFLGPATTAYLAGIVLLLLLRAAGMLRVRGIVARSAAAPGEVARAATRCAVRAGVGDARVRLSRECSLPFAAGLLRPVVVLPAAAAAWPAAQLEAVLLHELAHVRRRDPLRALVLDLGCAASWPNPLSWIAARRARALAERECDAAAVLAGALPDAFAGVLLRLARSARGVRLLGVAPGMAGRSDLARRVEMLLSGDAAAPPSRAVLGACAVLTLAVAGLAGACLPARAPAAFTGTPALTQNISDGGADVSTNGAGLQARWVEDGRHAGAFVTGDVDLSRVLDGRAPPSARQSLVVMAEDPDGRLRVLAWPGDDVGTAPWARRTLEIAARKFGSMRPGSIPPGQAPPPPATPAAEPARLPGSTMTGPLPSVSTDPGAGVIQAGWIADGRRTGLFLRGDWSVRGGRLYTTDPHAWLLLFSYDPGSGTLRRIHAEKADGRLRVDARFNGEAAPVDEATLRWTADALRTLHRLRAPRGTPTPAPR